MTVLYILEYRASCVVFFFSTFFGHCPIFFSMSEIFYAISHKMCEKFHLAKSKSFPTFFSVVQL